MLENKINETAKDCKRTAKELQNTKDLNSQLNVTVLGLLEELNGTRAGNNEILIKYHFVFRTIIDRKSVV